MEKLLILDENTKAIIATLLTIIPIFIIMAKIWFYIKFFQICKDIKKIHNNQDAIIRTLIEISHKKD